MPSIFQKPFYKAIPLYAFTKYCYYKGWPNREFTKQELEFCKNIGYEPLPGYIIIDSDIKNGISGEANLKLLFRKFNLPLSYLDTLTVLTPSGGKHFYLKVHSSLIPLLAHKANNSYYKIDLITKGAYAVAPGSKILVCTEQCGKITKNCPHKKEMREYKIINDAPLKTLPASFKPLIQELYSKPKHTSNRRYSKTFNISPDSRSEKEYSKTKRLLQKAISEDEAEAKSVILDKLFPDTHQSERGKEHTLKHDTFKAFNYAKFQFSDKHKTEEIIKYSLRDIYKEYIEYSETELKPINEIYQHSELDTILYNAHICRILYAYIDKTKCSEKNKIRHKVAILALLNERHRSEREISIHTQVYRFWINDIIHRLKKMHPNLVVFDDHLKKYRINKNFVKKHAIDITTLEANDPLFDFEIYVKYTDNIDAEALREEGRLNKERKIKANLKKSIKNQRIINLISQLNDYDDIDNYNNFVTSLFQQRINFSKQVSQANGYAVDLNSRLTWIGTYNLELIRSIKKNQDINFRINEIDPEYNDAYNHYQVLLNLVCRAIEDSETGAELTEEGIIYIFRIFEDLKKLYLKIENLTYEEVNNWIKKVQQTTPVISQYIYCDISNYKKDISKNNNILNIYNINDVNIKQNCNNKYVILNDINNISEEKKDKISKIPKNLLKPTALERRLAQNIAIDAIRAEDKNILSNPLPNTNISKKLQTIQNLIYKRVQDTLIVQEQIKKLPELVKNGNIADNDAKIQLQELDEWLNITESEIKNLRKRYEKGSLKEPDNKQAKDEQLKKRNEQFKREIEEYRSYKKMYRYDEVQLRHYIADPIKFKKDRLEELGVDNRIKPIGTRKDNNVVNDEYIAKYRESMRKVEDARNNENIKLFNELKAQGVIKEYNAKDYKENIEKAIDVQNKESMELFEKLRKKGII